MAFILLLFIVVISLFLMIFNRELLLYYFVFLYPILPEYFALNISESLPLLTASRLILFCLIIGCLIRNRFKIKLTPLKQCGAKNILLFYFFINLIDLLSHYNNNGNIKEFFSCVLEEIIFVIVILNMVKTQRIFDSCLKSLFFSSVVVFIMGIFEPLTNFNIASTFLNTESRSDVLISVYERFGGTRAVFSFGHSICLGVFCIAMLPICVYFFTSKRNKNNYLYATMLCFGCLLMTMSRGPILVGIAILILYMIKMNRIERTRLLNGIGILVILSIVVMVLVEPIRNIALDSLLSSLNAIGANFNTGNIGDNANAIYSRLAQFSLIPQILKEFPIFGAGSGYLNAFKWTVYTMSSSFTAASIDMEYLSWLLGSGIFGLLGRCITYFLIMKLIWKKVNIYSDPQLKVLFFSIIGILICYLSVTHLTTNRIFWLLISFGLAKINIDRETKLQNSID